MSYQFNISPPIRKKNDTKTVVIEKEETPVLILAPFTPNLKISFDNIRVGTDEARLLILRNPSNQNIEINLSKQPPPERNLKISFETGIVPAQSEIYLKLIWYPGCEGAWRDTLTFESGRLKKDVLVSYKSVSGKKKEINSKRKLPTVLSKKVKTPPKIFKTSKFSKISPYKKCNSIHPQKSTKPPTIVVTNYDNKRYHKEYKENRNPIQKSYIVADGDNFVSPSKINFNDSIDHNIRFSRNTYTINDFNKPQIKEENLNNGFEKHTNENFRETKPQGKIYLKDLSNMIKQPVYPSLPQTPQHAANLQNQLNSSLFQLTPIQTYRDIRVSLELHPDLCSTNQKFNNTKTEEEIEILPPSTNKLRLSAFKFDFSFTQDKENTENVNDENLIKPLNELSAEDTYIKDNINTETYVKEICNNETNQKKNLSSETYVKRNLSSETYVKTPNDIFLKANVSTETCGDIQNVSSSTRLGDEYLNNIPNTISPMRSLNLSGDGMRRVLEANLWCKEGMLDFISEETHLPTSSDSDNESPRQGTKRKSDIHVYNLTPPKKSCTSSKSNWNKTCYRRSSILNISKPKNQLLDKNIKNPFIIATTTAIDPFLSRNYYDPEWIDVQEKQFVKCLNLLLTPPDEEKVDEKPPDVGKLWNESNQKNVTFVPSKQQTVSKNYFVAGSLNNLRKTALSLYRSEGLKDVLGKIAAVVDSNKLTIRKDKNPHLNVGLQNEIMNLLLSYNPFWLQIGLEVVYGTTLDLQPKSLVTGLIHFLQEKFFKNALLLRKYKTSQSEKYTLEIKKIILKKFLNLVYFLDVAKDKKLIFYDPCLFCKKAQIKESREILLHFSKELVYGVGDVTKYLKSFGYIVYHKQTYIHEYEYGIKDLGSDLRDGVHLTRIVELILLRNDLTIGLRVPAISRLQKIHNVKIAFDTLKSSGFEINGDIVPTDIVDGHREKTLSLLWQIIYKFQGPRYKEATIKIQMWWRSLYVQLKLRTLRRERETYERAATVIQRWYKRQKLYLVIRDQLIPIAKKVDEERKRLIAARKIVDYLKMRVQRHKYLNIKNSIILLQSQCRKYLVKREVKKRMWAIFLIQSFCKTWVARNRYLQTKGAAITIQQAFRGYRCTRKARYDFLQLRQASVTIQRRFRAKKVMQLERTSYLNLRSSAITIQQRYRARTAMKNELNCFQRIKSATIVIQTRYRSFKVMKKEREKYIEFRQACVTIQTKFKARTLMKIEKQRYTILTNATIFVQRKFRGNNLMKVQRSKYLALKTAAINLQRRWKALKLSKTTRHNYLKLRKAVIVVQQRFRANKLAKVQRNYFISLRKTTISVQQKFRANKATEIIRFNYQNLLKATTVIQQRYRAFKLMKTERNYYLRLQRATITIQRHYRGLKAMTTDKRNYQNLREAAIIIQKKYRALTQMRNAKNGYEKLRKTTITLQRKFRATKEMKILKKKFQNLRNATVIIQRRYRALKSMRSNRHDYLELRRCTIISQRRFRAKKIMGIAKNDYQKLRQATIVIQSRYRALRLMKSVRRDYLQLLKTTLFVQEKYRNARLTKIAKTDYQNLRKSTITIQRRYRATIQMRTTRNSYLELQKATITLQTQYRAKKAMEIARNKYQTLRRAAIICQRKYRAQKAMKTNRNYYLQLKEKTIFIQRQIRSRKATIVTKNSFQNLRRCTITVQQRYRALILMKSTRINYLKLREATILIQQKLRANRAMKVAKTDFQKLRKSAITIQQRYKANKRMNTARNDYLRLKRATVTIQRRFRANKAMKIAKISFQNSRKAAIAIQRRYRALKQMKNAREEYLELKKAAMFIQRKFRANKMMKIDSGEYQKLRKATVVIQQQYRALKLMKTAKQDYLQLRNAVIFVQRKYRANKMMKNLTSNYQILKKTTITVQRRYKAQKLMKIERVKYLQLQKAVVVIQTRFRANKLRDIARTDYKNLRKSAIFIQRRFRALNQMKSDRNDYLRLRTATKSVQNRFRANKLMKIEKRNFQNLYIATVTVQRRYRAFKLMKKARNNYLELQKTVLFLQITYRANKKMKHNRQEYLNLREATITIQRRYRAQKLMRKTKQDYLLLQKAALYVQRKYRAKRAMQTLSNNYQLLRKATVMIQRRYRAFKIMKQTRLEYVKLYKAVVYIQKKYRSIKKMKQERDNYLNLRNTTISLQRKCRAKITAKNVRNNYNKLKSVTVTIQRLFKRRSFARKIRQEFLEVRKATVTIQRRYRANKLMKIERSNYLKLKTIVKRIQTIWRAKRAMLRDRINYLKLRKAAKRIQQWYRSIALMKKERQRFLSLKKSTLIIQRRYRAQVTMKKQTKNFLILKETTIIVQRKFRANKRMIIDRSRFLNLKRIIIKLQRQCRKFIQERNIEKRKMEGIIGIQKHARGYLIRKQFKEKLESKRKELEEIVKIYKAATKIQATWKGYLQRKRSSSEVNQIYNRLETATNNAQPEKTLGHRREQCLQLLIYENPSMGQIIRALTDLDFITRRCRDTCTKLSKILPENLFKMIVSAIRSLPDMKASVLSTSILINFCKYPPTKKASWLPGYIGGVLQVMLHWCDKEEPLFPHLCTLMWLFAQDENYRKFIVQIPNVHNVLVKMKGLCQRKHKMWERSSLKGISLFSMSKGLPLPLNVPDWGLDYADRPRIFNNSVHALNCLIKELRLKFK